MAATALAACSSAAPSGARLPASGHPSPSPSAATASPPVDGAADARARGDGPAQSSQGLSSSEIETTSDGSTPVKVTGKVSSPVCGAATKVLLTLAVTRDGRPLAGNGTVLELNPCGPFSQDLHPTAGRVRVRADVLAGDGVSVDLTIASAGQVSHSSVGGSGGNSDASAISIN